MAGLLTGYSLSDKIRFIITATLKHATNLLKFATIYKSILFVLRRLQGKEAYVDTFIAGAVGGYIVFHEDNAINQQVGEQAFLVETGSRGGDRQPWTSIFF